MNGVVALAKRNALCFFRDRASVFFSLMAVLIVLLLYLLFLRNLLIESMLDGGLEFASEDQVSNLIDSWVLAGILAIVSVTSSAGSLQCMVEDKVSGKDLDFKITRMKPWQITTSYILSTAFVGLVMSVITLVIALVFLFATGCIMETSSIIMCAVLVIPSTLSGSIIIFGLVSFLKSQGAFSGFFSVLSTLIGFLTGIYMPLGNLPAAIQVIGTLMPATQMAALFRNYLCSGSLKDVFGPYDTSEFRQEMGFDLSIGGFEFTPEISIIYVIAVTAVFFCIAVFMMKRK
ncbi:MAG: ABC transporter permease [Thermoplasmata archaeon]|jgi:multidrug/hemolysin transport system permease protein|nr:ABC transporter permease [Thermoplasmata archaeon]